jgi:hypothetical protein
MLKHVETVQGGYFDLKIFHPAVLKLKYLPALCADEMVVVQTEVPVFVKGRPALKFLFYSKAITAEQIERLLNEVGLETAAIDLQRTHELLKTYVALKAKKNFQDGESFVDAVDSLTFKKALELLFFLVVNCLHPLPSLL